MTRLRCRYAGLLLMAGLAARARTPAVVAPPWTAVTFLQARETGSPQRYTIMLQSDGKGFYWEGEPDLPESDQRAVSKEARRALTVSASTMAIVSATLPVVASGNCETKQKHLAQTGRKTFMFQGAALARCDFNYSADERLNRAVTAFESIAETIQVAGKLMHDKRFDKLAMDADMDVLVEDVKQGQAIEVQNIADTLQVIAADESVMERVRRKAVRLLEAAGR